jgi:hypothetical protein
MSQSEPREPDSTKPKNCPKKAYTKPAFRHERVFETSALACGKVQMGSTCQHQKKVS